jgi:hypothetical protein
VGKVAQTMYTHVSKCKNDKIKLKKCFKPEKLGIEIGELSLYWVIMEQMIKT